MKFRHCSRRHFLQQSAAAGLGLAWLANGSAAAPALPALPDIEIEPGEWGDASTTDIRAVLKSAAGELWKHCGATKLDAFRVQFRKAGPITLFRRAADGRILIGLASSDRHWAQFSYQFAHEFVHALAAHGNDWKSKWHESEHANHWLEEALAELGSLFALRAMSKTWETSPPYANWKSFAPSLATYAADIARKTEHQLPTSRTFAEWLAFMLPELRKNPVNRPCNNIVARQLLPLFEREPSGWEAVPWLNLGKRIADQPLAAHLAEWRAACPKERQRFVSELAAVLGVKL